MEKRHIRALAKGVIQQFSDIDLLQAHAMTEDGTIINFQIFAKALSLRERAMVSFANVITPICGSVGAGGFLQHGSRMCGGGWLLMHRFVL
jgi:hypothetical protein